MRMPIIMAVTLGLATLGANLAQADDTAAEPAYTFPAGDEIPPPPAVDMNQLPDEPIADAQMPPAEEAAPMADADMPAPEAVPMAGAETDSETVGKLKIQNIRVPDRFGTIEEDRVQAMRSEVRYVPSGSAEGYNLVAASGSQGKSQNAHQDGNMKISSWKLFSW